MRALRCWKFGCSVALSCGLASAQSSPDARQCFDRGVVLAEQGDLDAAAQQFQEAYRISPNYAVLYNLGQAEVALGKPVEALSAFEQYLGSGGPRINPTRRAEVEALLSASRKRIGYVSVAVDPDGGEVSIDGRLVGKTPIREPLALVIGGHGVAITRAGYTPYVGRFDVEAQKTSAIEAKLVPIDAQVKPAGQLALGLAFPGITVSLDGRVVESNRAAPLLVSIGSHRVTCERQDYVASEHDIAVNPGSVASVTCDLSPRPQLPAAQLGILTFTVHELQAEIRIDGRHAASTVHLPRGPHSVRIRREGYLDWAQTVNAKPGFPQVIDVHLQETPEHALARSRAAQSKRTWAYVVGGAGLAFLGTGAALYLSNGPRFQRYETARDALSRDIQNQRDPGSWSARTADVRSAAVSVQRQDDVALGAALSGGALLTYAVVSWLGAD